METAWQPTPPECVPPPGVELNSRRSLSLKYTTAPCPADAAVLVENVAVRHKAIDDVILRECVPADGIKQVVVLNSGMDTRWGSAG
jgi:O-methyltransferase involved in polyketide biosynthesis